MIARSGQAIATANNLIVRRWNLFFLTTITFIGGYLRLFSALGADFPLNDGGLFFRMIQEMQSSNYRLPVFTTYNNSNIPFVYPPLGLYLTAGVSDLFGWSLVDSMRLLPPIIMVLTIPVFWLLAQRALGGTQEPLIATFVFAVLPSSFLWPIMGGGVTRAPGCLFALLALVTIYDLYKKPGIRTVFLASLCASLTVLSHSEATIFAAYGAMLLWCFFGRNRAGVIASLASAIGVLIFTAPWWALIFSRHGIAPFAAAAQSDSRAYWGISLQLTPESGFPLITVAGLLGCIICVLKGPKWLPIWLIVVLVLQSRGAEKFVAIPLALLAARAVGFFFERLADSNTGRAISAYARRRWLVGLMGVGLIYLVSAALLFINSATPLHTLSAEDRTAMQWLAAHTDGKKAFLILDDATWFGEDRVAEWFPALTDLVSVTTVQGTEWLPNGEFYRRWRQYDALKQCGAAVACLETLLQQDHQFGYIYVSKQGLAGTNQSQALEQALRSDARYNVIYDSGSVLVFALKNIS